MKKISVLLLSLFACGIALAQTFPVVNLKVGGPAANRINIVILPDGFTAAGMALFQTTATNTTSHMFDQTPLKEYINFYNVYCINVPSVDSGTDHPANATDVTEPVIPFADVNTYFNCTFDGNFTHRALTCRDLGAVHSVMAANFPAFDQLVMIANSPEYGGTGGEVATTSLDASGLETVRHELGHSFAGLADEYWAGTVFAAEKPNMTAVSDTAAVKWHNWLHKDNVGVYKYGTTGDAAGWYRPHQFCKMQYLNYPFCHVCQEAFINRIYELMRPIDSVGPDTLIVASYTGSPIPFTIKPIRPKPNTLKIRWAMNNVDLPYTDTTLLVTGAMLGPGTNELVAWVTDTTGLSRSFWPLSGYQFPITWSIQRNAAGISVIDQHNEGRFFYKLYPVPVKDVLTLAYDNDTRDVSLHYTISDITGKSVRAGDIQMQPGKGNTAINTSGMIPGNYMLSLRSRSINVTEQVMVE